MGVLNNLLTGSARHKNDKFLHLKMTVVLNVAWPQSLYNCKVFYTGMSTKILFTGCCAVNWFQTFCLLRLLLASLYKCGNIQKLQLETSTTVLGGFKMNRRPFFEALRKSCRVDSISLKLKSICVISTKAKVSPFLSNAFPKKTIT